MLNIAGDSIAGDIIGAGSSNTINFVAGAGTFTYGASFGFSGINQVNVNSGDIILNGTNGAANVAVNGGTLQIGDAANPSATLTATNPVDVFGTLSGHGTLIGGATVENGGPPFPLARSALSASPGRWCSSRGSHYGLSQLSPTQHSQTNVTGSTTINGSANVVLTPQLGTYSPQTITILTSSTGVTGTFNPTLAYTGSTTLSGAVLSYDTNDVFLTYGSSVNTLFLPSSLTINERNVGDAINSVILGGGNLPGGFQNLAALSGGSLAGALDQLSGEVAAGFAQLAFKSDDLFLRLMINPYNPGRNDGLTPGPQTENSLKHRYGSWAAVYGAGGTVGGDATVGSHDVTDWFAGLAAGFDYSLSPSTDVGFALSGGGTSYSLAGGLGSSRSDLFKTGVYDTTRWGAAYLSTAMAYSWYDVTTDRTVTVAGTGHAAFPFQRGWLVWPARKRLSAFSKPD